MGKFKVKRNFNRLWNRVRDFDYSDLSFLYIACLVTVAIVYTIFRSSHFYLNRQELMALNAVEKIEAQRRLSTELQHLISAVQATNGTERATFLHKINDTYGELSRGHSAVIGLSQNILKRCANRPCSALADPHFFATANEPIEQMEQRVRTYDTGLIDSMDVSFDIIRAKNKAGLTFDLIAYFSLLVLLMIQAVYVFRPAIRRLNASLATRSEFLSRISHEIRNPMNSILGMADILKGTRLNFEQAQYVDNLTRSGGALLDMLNNLIDFSVIENGKLNIVSGPFDLFRTLDRGLSLTAIQAHHKNLNLYVQIDPLVPSRLRGDAARIDQILINLLNNAVKFTEQGSITLTIELLDEDRERAQILFSVSDTGIGILAENLAKIFGSFVQVDSSIQRKYGGSGLGLSISHEILKQMGSHLDVESTFGKGSKFYFSLDLEKNKSGADSAPLLPLGTHHAVFLVAAAEALAYQSSFTKLGANCQILHSAKDFAALLNVAQTRSFNEILVDDSVGIISMINCRNLAEQHGLGEKTIALMRTNFSKENMELLKRNGFNRFLFKPLKPWDLLVLPPPVPQDALPEENVPSATPAVVDKLKAKNLKILLVDDSNDNLFLLRELVNPVASTVHFAENGLEAIEKFRAQSYDVVFMDIQMPVMDGYTAIRKMRECEMELDPKTSIPIYAVTAHAGLVDAQKCREAGFTDRIVKPVMRSDIYNSLSKAFSVEHGGFEAEADNEPTVPQKYLIKLLPVYFKTREEDMEKLRHALDQRDFKTIKNMGHKIKGSAASYGFGKTKDLSLRLEQAAQTNDLDVCGQIVQRLQQTLDHDKQRLQN